MLFSAALTFASKCRVPKVEGQHSFCIVKGHSNDADVSQACWMQCGEHTRWGLLCACQGLGLWGQEEGPVSLQRALRSAHEQNIGTELAQLSNSWKVTWNRPPSVVKIRE